MTQDHPCVVRTVGSFAAAAATVSRAGGGNLSSSAANGTYNFGAGTTAIGNADRAVGFLSSGTATASGNLYAQLANSMAAAFTDLDISYTVEKYRNGLNAAGVTVPPGGTFYLAWNYSVQTGATTSNAQALAIDDITLLGGAGDTPPADTAPSVVGTIPAHAAGNVPVKSSLVVKFSENVNATAAAFALQCPAGALAGHHLVSASVGGMALAMASFAPLNLAPLPPASSA